MWALRDQLVHDERPKPEPSKHYGWRCSSCLRPAETKRGRIWLCRRPGCRVHRADVEWGRLLPSDGLGIVVEDNASAAEGRQRR